MSKKGMPLGFHFVPFPQTIWDDGIELSHNGFKLLGYLIRHSISFRTEWVWMTDDEVINGRLDDKDRRLDKGSGIKSVNGLKAARAELIKIGWLEIDTDDSDRARIKRYYRLVLTSDQRSTADIETPKIGNSSVSTIDTQTSTNDTRVSTVDGWVSTADIETPKIGNSSVSTIDTRSIDRSKDQDLTDRERERTRTREEKPPLSKNSVTDNSNSKPSPQHELQNRSPGFSESPQVELKPDDLRPELLAHLEGTHPDYDIVKLWHTFREVWKTYRWHIKFIDFEARFSLFCFEKIEKGEREGKPVAKKSQSATPLNKKSTAEQYDQWDREKKAAIARGETMGRPKS